MTARCSVAIADPHANVLGHCTGRLVQGGRGTRPQSEFDAETGVRRLRGVQRRR